MRFQISDLRFQIWRLARPATRFRARVRIGGVLLTVAAVAATPCAARADEIIDRVLAVAGGYLIMQSDVMAATDLGLVSPGTAADPTREVLSRLIDRALVLSEVDRYAPPEPGADAVDRAVLAVRSRFASPDEMARAMARVGMNEAHLRETLRQDLRIRAYYEQRFTVAPPADEELGRYYREHPESFRRDGALIAFADVRQEIVQTMIADRRRSLAEEWIAGLRRRAEVVDRYAGAGRE
jgi:hypothetical protein